MDNKVDSLVLLLRFIEIFESIGLRGWFDGVIVPYIGIANDIESNSH